MNLYLGIRRVEGTQRHLNLIFFVSLFPSPAKNSVTVNNLFVNFVHGLYFLRCVLKAVLLCAHSQSNSISNQTGYKPFFWDH